MTDAQHLLASGRLRYTLFAPFSSLSYIKEVNKRKHSTVGYSAAEKKQDCCLAVGCVMIDRCKGQRTSIIAKDA